MKKRIAALILTIVLLISLSSCTWVDKEVLFPKTPGGRITSTFYITAKVMTESRVPEINEVPMELVDKLSAKEAYRLYQKLDKNRISKNREIEIKVGFGQSLSSCDYALFTISAPGLIIIAPDGVEYKDEYTCEYTDFDDEKYKLIYVDDQRTPQYFETFRFLYDDTNEVENGAYRDITFNIYGDYIEGLDDPSTEPQMLGKSYNRTVQYQVKRWYLIF